MEQITGIEPVYPAWKAGILPLNYICILGGGNHPKLFKLSTRENLIAYK